MKLIITVKFDNDKDFEELRFKCIESVEDTIEVFVEEELIKEGTVDVSWDTE